MKFVSLSLGTLALLACHKSTPPTVKEGEAPPPLVSSHADVIKNTEPVSPDRAALFKELKPEERIMAHMPKISCAQTSLQAGQLSISCRLLQNRTDFKPNPGTTITFTYSHSSRSFNPTIGSGTTVSVGKYDFTDPDNWKNFYYADTGRFGAMIIVDGREFPIPHEKVQVLGETCAVPIPGLINMRNPGTGYMTLADSGAFINQEPPVEGGRYIVAGVRGILQTNNTNPGIIALNSGKVDFRGAGARIHLMDTASLTMLAPASAGAIFAGPFATAPDDPAVHRFETDLGLCERQ